MLVIAGGVILGLFGFLMIVGVFNVICDLFAWIVRRWRISLIVTAIVAMWAITPWITP